MSIDPKFVELTADVLQIFFFNVVVVVGVFPPPPRPHDAPHTTTPDFWVNRKFLPHGLLIGI